MHITVSTDAVTINGHTWFAAPFTKELCQAIGSSDLVDGDPVLFDGKPELKFRYLDGLGIGILETIPESRVRDITIFMQAPVRRRKTPSPYGEGGQRPTQTTFSGLLEINGKQLRSPLRFTRFPLRGELTFDNRMAFGGGVNAHVAVSSGFVTRVSFEFKRCATK